MTGPESAGKTTLARTLASALSVPMVNEVARAKLLPGQPYNVADLQDIAMAQHQLEQQTESANRLVIADTDVSVIAIWWRDKFAQSDLEPWPAWLDGLLRARTTRYYLLCQPDLNWEPDPLRENPLDRDRLFTQFRCLLQEGPYSWDVVRGDTRQRTSAAFRFARVYLDR